MRIAEREGVPWEMAQAVALTCGLDTIEARGGLSQVTGDDHEEQDDHPLITLLDGVKVSFGVQLDAD